MVRKATAEDAAKAVEPEKPTSSGISDDKFREIYDAEKARWKELTDRLK